MADLKKERIIEQGGSQFWGDLVNPWSQWMKLPSGLLRSEEFGSLRCKGCKERRSMDLHWHGATAGSSSSPRLQFPGLAIFVCRQCRTEHPAGIWIKDGTANVRIELFDAAVSVTTPNTHPTVAHYLEEAAKAKGAGAKSAAAAMFRAALESVLYEKGFQERNLGPKIKALEAQLVEAATAPAWTRDLSIEELTALKKLGDGAIHPNDGDVERQAAIEDGVLESVELVFEHLLDKIYEEPLRRADRLKRLTEAATTVSGKATVPPQAEASAPPPALPPAELGR